MSTWVTLVKILEETTIFVWPYSNKEGGKLNCKIIKREHFPSNIQGTSKWDGWGVGLKDLGPSEMAGKF